MFSVPWKLFWWCFIFLTDIFYKFLIHAAWKYLNSTEKILNQWFPIKSNNSFKSMRLSFHHTTNQLPSHMNLLRLRGNLTQNIKTLLYHAIIKTPMLFIVKLKRKEKKKLCRQSTNWILCVFMMSLQLWKKFCGSQKKYTWVLAWNELRIWFNIFRHHKQKQSAASVEEDE